MAHCPIADGENQRIRILCEKNKKIGVGEGGVIVKQQCPYILKTWHRSLGLFPP